MYYLEHYNENMIDRIYIVNHIVINKCTNVQQGTNTREYKHV